MAILTPRGAVRTCLIICFALTGAGSPAVAQIVIGEAWFEAQMDTTIETRRYFAEADARAQAIYDDEFEDGTFDFSYLGMDSLIIESTTPSYSLPGDFPGADLEEFATADYVTVVTDYDDDGEPLETSYVYYRIDPDALVQLGWYSVLRGDLPDLKVVFEPELRPSPIPVAFDAEAEPWVTEAEQVTYIGSSEVGRVGYRISLTVEGYGSLTLPSGTFSALRIRHSINRVGEPPTESILFRSLSDHEARIVLDSNGDISHVTYTTRTGVSTSAERPVAGLPSGYRLDQNYPNPFNPSTTIGFAVPQTQHVRLTVHDALGRQVATLVDGQMAAGSHEVVFRADDLPSGMYMYRLNAGSVSTAGIMVLLK